MRGAVMVKVPEADLTVTAGEGALTLYQWNGRIAKHYFCSNCGIYVFHNKRAAPDHFGVNVRCLTDVSITTRHRGRKYEREDRWREGALARASSKLTSKVRLPKPHDKLL